MQIISTQVQRNYQLHISFNIHVQITIHIWKIKFSLKSLYYSHARRYTHVLDMLDPLIAS